MLNHLKLHQADRTDWMLGSPPLQAALRTCRDAQHERLLQRVVEGHEGARVGAAGRRLQHGRLDLPEQAPMHE